MKTRVANFPDLDAALSRQRPWLCPELELWLLDPESDAHRFTDPEALGMPYWAFAWPGGQVLARYVLDHPELVRGRRVLDFGSGCAIEALAALKAGAHDVLCADLDPRAARAASDNAQLNGVTVRTTTDDWLGRDVDAEVILAGDVCYSAELVDRVTPWLARQVARGVEVLLGDPLRVESLALRTTRVATFDASYDGDSRGRTLWKTHVLRVTD